MNPLIVFLLLLVASIASAEKSSTLFTLERVNYKPEKILRYDLIYDEKTCALNRENPFDVYYVEASTGNRLTEFSSNSKQYFLPRIEGAERDSRSIELNFKALDEIRSLTGRQQKIIAVLERQQGQCQAQALITGNDPSSQLLNIQLKMKLKFGLPVGVTWVRTTEMVGQQVVENCLTDICE